MSTFMLIRLTTTTTATTFRCHWHTALLYGSSATGAQRVMDDGKYGDVQYHNETLSRDHNAMIVVIDRIRRR